MTFDWTLIVFTCRSERIAAFLRNELIKLKWKGALHCSPHTEVLVVADPSTRRTQSHPSDFYSVGSGGATLNALLVAAERLSSARHLPVLSAEVLQKAHILFVLTGRHFEYEPLGRMFLPLPLLANGDRAEGPVTLLEHLLHTFSTKLADPSRPGVWICSTDMLLEIPERVEFNSEQQDNEILALTVPVAASCAREHGVYLLNADGCVEDMLYREPEPSAVPVSRAGTVHVVSGVVYLPVAVAARLLALALYQPLDGCTYQGLDGGALPLQLSLFFDVLLTACAGVDQQSFLSGLRTTRQQQADRFAKRHLDTRRQLEASARKLLWEKLHGQVKLRAVIAKEGRYTYLNLSGSQLISWYLATARSPPVPPALSSSSTSSRCQALTPSSRVYSQFEGEHLPTRTNADANADADADAILINSFVGPGVRLGARLVLVDSVLPNARAVASVGRDSFLSGLKSYDLRAEDEQPTAAATTTADGGAGGVVIPERLVLQGFWVRRAPLVLGVGAGGRSPRKKQRLRGAHASATDDDESLRVLVVWGVDDALDRPLGTVAGDAQSTFCGQKWDAFLQRTGIRADDLWFASKEASERTLFTARLYPLISTVDTDSNRVRPLTQLDVMLWLAGGAAAGGQTDAGDEDAAVSSHWRSSLRVSLGDILEHADLERRAEESADLFYSNTAALVERVLREGLPIGLRRFFFAAAIDNRHSVLMNALDTLVKCSTDKPAVCARVFANIAELLAAQNYNDAVALRSGPAANPEWALPLHVLKSGDIGRAVGLLLEERELWTTEPTRRIRAARHLEAAAQILITQAVRSCSAFISTSVSSPTSLALNVNTWITAECPARLDLAGGWSDTPPICYEHGGAVCNVAVLVNGIRPIGARVRLIREPIIRCAQLPRRPKEIRERDASAGGPKCTEDDEPIKFVLCETSDLRDYNQPNALGALLKACLICSDIVSVEKTACLRNQLRASLGGDNYGSLTAVSAAGDVGLEIETWSELPQGSGLGGSSILGAAVLAALWRVVGRRASHDDIIHAVLNVEQVMTTGGGWQDQVGAVYGGVKRGRSGATLPLRVYIDYVGQASASASASQCAGDADADASRTPTTTNEIRLSKAQLSPAQAASLADFDERLVLIYTGKTRLARNLLQDVIRNWYARDATLLATVDRLEAVGNECFAAFRAGEVAAVARCVDEYWQLKQRMAPGCEPAFVTRLRGAMQSAASPVLCCVSLAGAGGGGFLYGLLAPGVSRATLEATLSTVDGAAEARIYSARVDFNGIQYS